MKYSALFIGLTTIDIQYFVDHFPKTNVKIKTAPPDILVGGPATNAAVAFAKLNGGTFLASASGQNSFSEYISNDFNATNISHFDLIKEQKANPVIASVVTSGNGERNIFTHNPEKIKSNFSAKALFEKVNPELILLDGFYPEFSIECAQLAKQKNIRVVLDCGSWKPQYDSLFEFTDVAICSNDFYPPSCKTSQQVFQYLIDKKISKIAISRGEKDVLFFNETYGEITVNKTKTIDTMGAGDFLHGAFCFYYLNLCKFEEAVQKAAEFASFSCKFKGTRDWLILSD